MITPKGYTPNPNNDIDHRIVKTDTLRRETDEICHLLHDYANTVLRMTNLEQQLATRLKVWYTDYSIYSPIIKKLKEIMDRKAGAYQKEATHILQALEKQDSDEEVYSSIRASIHNYSESSKRYEHYERKMPKLRSDSEKDRQEHKGNTRSIEKMQRNERKYENAMIDTDVYAQQIIMETNRLNLRRFNKMNPIVRIFFNLQLKEAFKMQEQLIDIENYEQVFNNEESELFNKKFFDSKRDAPVRVAEHLEEVSRVRTVAENHRTPNQSRVKEQSQSRIDDSGRRFGTETDNRILEQKNNGTFEQQSRLSREPQYQSPRDQDRYYESQESPRKQDFGSQGGEKSVKEELRLRFSNPPVRIPDE